MDGWNIAIQLITSVGFPIAACCAMGFFVKHITDAQRTEVKELNEQHTKEMLAFKDEMTGALNNNTLALQKLCDRLDKG